VASSIPQIHYFFSIFSYKFRRPSEVLASLPFFPENVEVSAMAYCLEGDG
jgi:hypothetical protein